jgi:hypothetical protein
MSVPVVGKGTERTMNRLIRVNEGMEKVKAHTRTAYKNALALGGKVGEAATARLSEAVAALDVAEAGYRQAADREATAWSAVTAESSKSEVTIGTAHDILWNALGRPRPSAAVDQVFPGGIWAYSPRDKRRQPRLLEVLVTRLRSTPSDLWPTELRESLVARIEQNRQSLQRVLADHEPVDAAVDVARAAHKAAVRTAHDRLRAFKRDLLSLGLSEAAIHGEIIPDASRPEHHEEGPTKKAA